MCKREQLSYDDQNNVANRDRKAMHRRAQRAEGALERARYWFEAVRFYGEKIGDGYLSAIAGEALVAMNVPDKEG